MPSSESRLAAIGGRVFSAVSWRPYYPLKYQRFTLSRIAPMLQTTPRGVTVQPVSANGVPAAWVIPEGCEDDKVILYLHGGAFVIGSIDSHKKMVGHLARAAGCRALLIDYRLAPEHPFPAALDDRRGSMSTSKYGTACSMSGR